MARPEINYVDYFPFYCKSGKTTFVLESKYGNDGFATWVKLLRELASTDFHHLNFGNEIDLIYFSSKCLISPEKLTDILDILAKFGEIDSELWTKYKCVWNQKLVDSIQNAYDRRKTETLNRDEVMRLYAGLCSTKTDLLSENNNNNTQSKVKESKGEKSKVKESIVLDLPFQSEGFVKYWNLLITKNKHFLKKSPEQLESILERLSKLPELDATDAVRRTFDAGWMGIPREYTNPVKSPKNAKSQSPILNLMEMATQASQTTIGRDNGMNGFLLTEQTGI